MVAPYRATLTKLQDAAPPMPASVVHQVLARELGAVVAQAFHVASTTTRPPPPRSARCTSAVWADGRDVAVKIQYPGAGEALLSDCKQIGRAARLFAGWIPGIDIKPLVAGAPGPGRRGARLLARGGRADAASPRRSRDDPEIVVPAVVEHTDKVLVSASGSSPTDRWPG